ncbi:sensor histidine kinase NtrY-like [Limobrevibacterium gyesilva]|uniref:histidine kinase n=1 Tax=Limobrevibacterium gyesilva TaxID=2991712 RepID=A0AA41YNL3_9PROT|nr:PAS domain-containing sensor histidine kinase [Limobrevibacterium gyesilva]MCW3473798.1 PAS domain-containing sensor histidine kinase [Limobrevibacterium gyesilva]
MPEPARRLQPPDTRLRRIVDLLLGKGITLLLAAVALALGVATFVILARQLPRPNQVFALVLANLVVLLLLGAVLAGRLTRMWMERRRGSAGARLHVRLVLLFSVVAVTPAIVVAVFSTVFFNLGIQAWFNEPVRIALQESLNASRGYLEEHRNNIRADALGMSNDLARAGRLLSSDPNAFAAILAEQTALRGLTEAVIFEPVTGQIIASAGLMAGMGTDPPPAWATALARTGDVAVLGNDDSSRVRAVVQLDATPALMLQISRPVDQQILDHMKRTEDAVAEYERLDQNRSGLQVTFALIFALVALLVLAAAASIGLVMANQIARPVGGLIMAAERVRAGDLSVRVPEASTGDELAGLSRAFNRMTGQLAAQRTELMDAYSQIDERRRFTEAVLSGVSAGVIGLDTQGRIELPNRAACDLLALDLLAAIGQPLADVVPEFGPLLQEVQDAPERPRTAEVQIGPPTNRRTLLVRVGADRTGERHDGEASAGRGRSFGFVATFDDITELQSAQRKAAWADVARRIAHEIKNPLTPIQLSAERLKRRFAKEITSDPDTFIQCADTIVRHVGDIGRMVDEFSAFARMPQPVIKPADVGRVVRESLVLQKNARPEIAWVTDIPERGPIAPCDRRLLGQALTNLLQNAADAVAMRPRDGDSGAPAQSGRIEIAVRQDNGSIRISVADDGVGLPEQDRFRLTEPYVTHKPKGTGLGLAIVKKIMEDHGGRIVLEDRMPREDWPGQGTVAMLCLPAGTPEGSSDGS